MKTVAMMIASEPEVVKVTYNSEKPHNFTELVKFMQQLAKEDNPGKIVTCASFSMQYDVEVETIRYSTVVGNFYRCRTAYAQWMAQFAEYLLNFDLMAKHEG